MLKVKIQTSLLLNLWGADQLNSVYDLRASKHNRIRLVPYYPEYTLVLQEHKLFLTATPQLNDELIYL